MRVFWVASTLSICGCGVAPTERESAAVSSAGPSEASAAVTVTVLQAHGGKHDRFAAAITSRRTTGLKGKAISHYTLTGRAVRSLGGCVNEREDRFPDGPVGRRVIATLDPARGKGGPEGWCPGSYRGTVTYFEGFACPSTGTCRVPAGFSSRSQVVGRFSFRVR